MRGGVVRVPVPVLPAERMLRTGPRGGPIGGEVTCHCAHSLAVARGGSHGICLSEQLSLLPGEQAG